MTYIINAERIAEKRGRKEGIKKGEMRIICNMDENGFSIDDISRATGYTKEQIREILKNKPGK